MLTKLQRRFLSRRVCWLCEQRLHLNSCGGVMIRCSKEQMARRRAECLKTYKPRKHGD